MSVPFLGNVEQEEESRAGVIGHQGRIHPGRSGNPSQGTYTLSFTHTSHTTDNLEMPVNLPRMFLDSGRKPEYPEETPEARGEHANSTHTWRRWESNPQPWIDVLEAGKMGKCKDLSEFDKGQIVMARRLDQSISKTAAIVGCSRSAVVSIYQKWSKEGTVVNRRQGRGRSRLIDAHEEGRLARVIRSNRRATVAQIAEVNAGSDRKVSEYTGLHY
ncbi:hypothetical protein QTP70_016739, partial [Hemibagrus guttatus]